MVCKLQLNPMLESSISGSRAGVSLSVSGAVRGRVSRTMNQKKRQHFVATFFTKHLISFWLFFSVATWTKLYLLGGNQENFGWKVNFYRETTSYS